MAGRHRAAHRGITAYLDYNATTPVRPEVAAAIAGCLQEVGNPSSVHAAGRAARRRLEIAREQVAALVGAEPGGVIFTSGATEANNLARHGAGTVLASAIEHPSVLDAGPIVPIPVDRTGVVDLGGLDRLLAEREPDLVAVMLANNETGVVQPLADITARAHAAGARVHADAVQAPGKLDLEAIREATAAADSLSLSAHKIGGPQGAGALIVRGERPPPLLRGGGQESHRRAGTENLPGIVGFGVAAGLIQTEPPIANRLASLRDRLESAIHTEVPEAMVFGQGVPRLPNTSCLAMPGVGNETQLIAFDLAGIAVSSGAACSSGKVGPSHVLAAMGVDPEHAGAAIRVSLGWATTEADVDRFIEVWLGLHRSRVRRDRAGTASSGCAGQLQSVP